MSDKVTIKLVGDNPRPVFGKLMLPGEERDIHPAQWRQLQAQYPDQFEGPEPEKKTRTSRRRKKRAEKPEAEVGSDDQPGDAEE